MIKVRCRPSEPAFLAHQKASLKNTLNEAVLNFIKFIENYPSVSRDTKKEDFSALLVGTPEENENQCTKFEKLKDAIKKLK